MMPIELTYGGETKTLYAWSKEIGIHDNTLRHRYHLGWSSDAILFMPVRPRTNDGTCRSSHRLYSVWMGMKARCDNPKNSNYKWYGARGIKVCERWYDFKLFLEDVETWYEPGLTLDRTDNDGNYYPGNCTWETMKHQNENKRRSGRYRTKEHKYSLEELKKHSEKSGIPVRILHARLHVSRWSLDRAIEEPVAVYKKSKSDSI